MISVQTLIRRCLYGGRKGRRAFRRLMAMDLREFILDGTSGLAMWKDGRRHVLYLPEPEAPIDASPELLNELGIKHRWVDVAALEHGKLVVHE